MSYLKDAATVDHEFEAGSSSDEEAAGVEQFRLENIKDRPPIFDAEALHDAYEDIAWAEPADWTQTQVVTLPTQTDVPDVHDDLQRELAFYKQGKAAAEVAIQRFAEAGVPWQRPPDYYAESVKSDGHMAKVKQQLMFEQRLIEEAEQRRKARETKQYAKQVQAEKQKERVRSKKDQIAEITKLRKQRASTGFQGDLEFDKNMKAKQRMTPDKAGQRIRQDGNKAGKKRQVRDAKFGFGGRKKLQKQNSAESSADMRGARTGKPGGTPGGKPGKGKAGLGPKGGVKKRPGKEARSAKRSRGGGR